MSRWSVAVIWISACFAKAVVRPIASIAAVLLTAGELCAHDFWIEPSTFRPAPGATVAIGLRVGQNFVGDPVPRSSQLLERFVVRQDGKPQLDCLQASRPCRLRHSRSRRLRLRRRPTCHRCLFRRGFHRHRLCHSRRLFRHHCHRHRGLHPRRLRVQQRPTNPELSPPLAKAAPSRTGKLEL